LYNNKRVIARRLRIHERIPPNVFIFALSQRGFRYIYGMITQKQNEGKNKMMKALSENRLSVSLMYARKAARL
jgi:hypothetical protein